MNNSAPFWDFLAGLEQQGSQHPFFGQNRNEGSENDREMPPRGPQDPFAPFRWGQHLFGAERGMPHHGGPPHGRHEHGHEEAGVEHNQERNEQTAAEKDDTMNTEKDNGEGSSARSGSDNEAHNGGRPHGRCGGGRRGHYGRGGPGPNHPSYPHAGPPRHGPHHRGHRGGWGPWTRGGPFGGIGGGNPWNSFDPSTFAAQLFNQFNDTHPFNTTNATKPTEPEDYTPDADIFDTESAYVVHVSLPGAKKEDVGVNWDAEKSELSVAGVIYRPGGEEFLKTLALNERKVGAFERKIRLGTRANPASVDADGITAKLEDGVLRVEVPKLDSGYVEIRKVDIE
jgi:HSP20 family protein